MSGPDWVRPSLRVLSQAQLEQIHNYSMRILSSVGVRIDSERARQLFVRATSPSLIEAERVFLSHGLVEWALQTAPAILGGRPHCQWAPMVQSPDELHWQSGIGSVCWG